MKLTKTLFATACLVLVLTAASQADSLEKRHGIGIRLGMWNMSTESRTEILTGSVETSVGSSGFVGGVVYNHWLTESFALDISVSALAADVDNRTEILDVTTETSVVSAVLFGVKWYFAESGQGGSVRPFVRAAVGPFIGSQSRKEVTLTVIMESRTENALGGHLGGGVDFILSRYFLLGVNAGYNVMEDFDEPIGGSVNYAGPEFSVGLNFLFGRGVN